MFEFPVAIAVATPPNPVEQAWAAVRRKRLSRDQLVKQHTNLVRKIAHRMARQCPESYEDLEQIGMIGLLKAIARFDPNNGAAFSSFAVPYIRGEIQHFLRDHWSHVKVPRRAVELNSTVKRVKAKMAQAGVDLDEATVAKKIGIPEEKWRWVSEALDRKPLLDLDEIASLIPAPEDDEGDRSWLVKAVARMGNPHRYCITEKFWKGMSDSAIAKAHGVTEAEVRTWLDEGLQKLRQLAEDADGI